MDKLKMHTPNRADENFKKLAALFPNAVTETINENGEVVRAIDKDVLMQEISCTVVDGNEERYQFTWPDKKKSVLLANAPISKTLRPCREESVGKDGTPGGFDSENLYIEGDNLEVLKLLQETYLGKVKMIYIDPPYNTGNDFVYEDDFAQSTEEYMANSGQFDEEGNRLVKNLDSNGRFHTDWLNMIYPRLKIAKNLLSDDGVIFISIDDNEVDNLKKICNEVFGEENFVAQLIWQRAFSPKNDAKYISNSHDYILMYAKYIDKFKIGRLPRTEEANARYSNPDNDPRGVWTSSDMSVKTYNAEYDYPITTPSGKIIEPPSGRCWRTSKEAFEKLVSENRVYFGADGSNTPRIKRFLSELKYDGMAPTSILLHKDVGHSQEGSQEVTKLLNAGVFDGPKPVRLLNRLLTLANTDKDSIILDFFSGSATTAHAVMQLNAEDGGNRKFIMVQLPELCDGKSEAYKAGYKNICEIGKERIRRAGKKILEEKGDQIALGDEEKNPLDVGFKVFKLDTSNLKLWDNTPITGDDQIEMFTERMNSMIYSIKDDRTDMDVVYEVMLKMGVPLDVPVQYIEVNGKIVYIVGEFLLMIALFDNITAEDIESIAAYAPAKIICAESSFKDDSALSNAHYILRDKQIELKLV